MRRVDWFIVIILLLDFAIVLPILFVTNGRIWINFYFVFWYLIFLTVWYGLYIFFVIKLKKLPMVERFDVSFSIILLSVAWLGLMLTDGSDRTPINQFHWFWLVFRIVIILSLILYFGSRLSKHDEVFHKTKLDKIEHKLFYNNKYWKKFEQFQLSRKIGIPLFVFLLLFQTLVFFPLVTTPLRPIMAEKNMDEIESTVQKIIDGKIGDENKTIALLSWFERYSGNMFNTWRPPMIVPITSYQFYFSIAIGDPYFPLVCVRNNGDKNPLWIYTSRCGNCGEHCLLFTEMAQLAGLDVRRVHVNGVDHKWNEVMINNDSVIVDPSWVNFRDDEDGYDIDNSTYERKFGNLTFVYAKWPNNKTKIDVTENYTQLSHIEITTFDEFGQPISNVTIKVFSNEFGSKINTGLVITTDETGFCILEIGGSNVTLEFSNDEQNLFNSTTRTFKEHSSYNMTIYMRGIL